jgi:hypothetical protein
MKKLVPEHLDDTTIDVTLIGQNFDLEHIKSVTEYANKISEKLRVENLKK